MKITIDEKDLQRIIKEAVNKILSSASIIEDVSDNGEPVQQVDDTTMNSMMDVMRSNFDKQNRPKVGIFWYSPRDKVLFGTVAVDALERAEIEKRDNVTCRELHKDVWAKEYNKFKYLGDKNPFACDYKDIPRGRVFYDPETEVFTVMVGSWIKDYPEVKGLVKDEFNLNSPNTYVVFKIGIHWELGMGWGD